MRSHGHLTGSCLVVFLLLLFAGWAGAQEVSPRCEAAMDRAAEGYSRCLLRAEAKHARDENTRKLERRKARCETRFDRRTTRVTGRHELDECPAPDLVAAIGDRTVSYADAVSTEAGGSPALSYLYVQNGADGTLTKSVLTLTGVSRQTARFTDRPYRYASQVPTKEFVELWGEGDNSFAQDAPNADFTCEVGGQVVNQVVTLAEPVLDEVAGTLTYATTGVPFGADGDPFSEIACDGDAHLFIDSARAVADLGRTDLSCDVQQGFNFRADVSAQIGFLTSLKIGDIVLASDFAVKDPENNAVDMGVVGVMSFVGWTGDSRDPININVQVSEASKKRLADLVVGDGANVEIDFGFAAYAYDPGERKYYKNFHTNDTTLTGGRLYGVRVNLASSRVVPEPINYTLSLVVGPAQDEQQQLHLAASTVDRRVAQWGGQ